MERSSPREMVKQAGNRFSKSLALVERERDFWCAMNFPDHVDSSYAELDPNTRSQFSHRSRALVKLAQYLRHAI